MDSLKNNATDHPADFRTTHWSLVLKAAGSDSSERQTALGTLCRAYWYPLYAFARRQGRPPEEAEDVVQEFFLRLLTKNALASVTPDRGRFRSFLLASLKNFLANDWDRKQTVKRGGRCSILSWDEQIAEERYLLEPRDESTPEKLFDRSWALTVMQAVLEQLRKEYAHAGKREIFQEIQSYLEDEGAETYAQIAVKLNMSEGAVKMAVLRLRESFRERLRAQIAETVTDATEVDEELRYLFACFSK